ncbi:GHMP kinase [Salinicola endophyticus]|uniref:GHMP kinase n=1 Tax=Salinicola endophyticus TaxID=1949083 RepID=A0ABY8FQA4_9GAMM|nr:hypothetical protein [Salinicola endophyticus]WFF42069.1 GHMP kinase [Salinicola endophyticus]
MDVHTELAGSFLDCDALPKRATGQCFGTFGELLQGVLPNNRHFLVTLPVDLETVVDFEVNEDTRVSASIASRTKACRAADEYLCRNDLPPGGKLHFKSVFPAGKGLASSSADMVAAIRAAARAHLREVVPFEIECILRNIEPTDGVMYDGVVSFYHRDVELDERLGDVPPLSIIGACRSGECDTIKFNQTRHEVSAQLRGEYLELLKEIKTAFRNNDLKSLGAISTRSCELSQTFNPMPHLDTMHSLMVETDALGLIAAHSGTYLGLLYDVNDPERVSKSTYAQMKLQANRISSQHYRTV